MRDADYDALVGSIYDAALDGGRWAAALERLRGSIGAAAVCMEVHDKPRREIVLFEEAGLDPAMQAPFLDHYCHISPRPEPGYGTPVGEVTADFHYMSEREIERSEFHADFTSRFDLKYYAGVVLLNGERLTSVVVPQFSPRHGRAREHQIDLLRRVQPHFTRALRIADAVSLGRKSLPALHAVLERMEAGALLLDGRGCVLHANAAAAVLLGQSGGLRLRQGRLRAPAPADDAVLQHAVATATLAAGEPDAVAETEFCVRRRPPRSPLWLQVMPFAGRSGNEAASATDRPGGAAVLVVLRDPDAQARPRSDRLRRLFALTRTEASLASALAGGDSVQDWADRRRVSIHTARSHLARIKRKTGARSQADLVRLLLRGGAA